MQHRASIGVLVTATLVLSGRGDAQSARRVLHRPIPGDLPLDSASSRIAPPSAAQSIRNAAGPSSSWSDNQPVDSTIARPRASWDAPVRELDRQTRSPPGVQLNYQEVFTPAVAPFKRSQAYDALDELGRLTVRDPALRPVVVGEASNGATSGWSGRRSRFVGELLVELTPAWPTPVPGVAGEQRVVSYMTSTGQSLEFAQDSAGNLVVRGTEAGTVRLTYVLEAPESSFEPPFLPTITVQAAAAEVPASERPPVPSWLRASAEAVLARVGVTRSDPFDVALARLVGYFRAFRDAELPDARGPDVYTDLALNGVGACRHRAYALVPTLHYLGIPARYVGNEAHAWVEVLINRVGWVRIDLGGWDVRLNVSAASNRPAYQPTNGDPFPQPTGYSQGYTGPAASAARARDGGVAVADPATPPEPAQEPSADPSGTAEGRTPGASGASPGDGRNGSGGPGSGNGAGGARGAAGASGASSPGRAGADPGASSGPDEATSEDAEGVVRTALVLHPVRGDETAGFQTGDGFVRGSMVRVTGEVRDPQERGVGGLAVEIRLFHRGTAMQTLGTTVSRPDGHWEARVVLPAGLEPGDYNVRASTPGDAHHAPASGE